MSVEVRPLGVKCNIQCTYCYQHPQRDADQAAKTYDLEKIKAAVLKEGGPFTLFGGEPLLVPIADLESLWKWGLERWGGNSLQTNASLITDDHIGLFRRYNVHVGISMDGPEELNDARWAGSLRATRAATARSQGALERLCAEGMIPSLIITLHSLNTGARLPRLIEWTNGVVAAGIRSIRVHMLETESKTVQRHLAISDDAAIEALLAFGELERAVPGLNLDVFSDIRKLLAGRDDNVTCVWNACDTFTTRAVRGVEGNGQRSNCGRTNKDGIDFVKANDEGYERYLALYYTPQEYGGCSGCRFFAACKGQCPGTAIDNDWRNRSDRCRVWYALFEHVESELRSEGRVPISDDSRRMGIEKRLVDAWQRNRWASVDDGTSPRWREEVKRAAALAKHPGGE